MSKKKVMLIGWDAADWKIINKLMDKGEMPTMSKFVESGVMGNIATLDPPFSPMLWTTIATGVRPDKHGILGFAEPSSDGLSVRPVSSASRKVKAIWNILSQKGYNTNVVGWWPSYPVEPINGIMVSNHFQKVEGEKLKPLMKGTVHPPELSSLFAHFRVHPKELTHEHILPFVPNGAKVDQEKDKRIFSIAKILAEASNIHSVATWIAENQDWDFLAVYLDTVDHFCHGFMNYHPPKMEGISDKDFEIYQNVVSAGYKFHDMMLERLLQFADENTTVIILSDHGFHSDHLRPKVLPMEPAGPAFQHRDYGIFAIKGPNIKKDERIYGVSLLDITPTILQLFDLPIADDMDGTPLVQAFEKIPEIKRISSWELVDGNAGMLPKDMRENTYEAAESMKQLVELGYIEEPEKDMKKNVENIILELDYNLARVYLGSQRYENAIDILEKLFSKKPDEGRYAFRLIESYKSIGKYSKCREILDKFKIGINNSLLSEEELKKIQNETIDENLKDEEKAKLQKEKRNKIKKNRSLRKNLLQLNLVEGELLEADGKMKKALEKYHYVEKFASKSTNVLRRIADLYLKTRESDNAINYYKQVLENDPDNHQAFFGLANCYLSTKEYELAVENILDSISLIYYNSNAHFILGQALYNLGLTGNACEALEVALAINQNNVKARNLLIEIYEKDFSKKEDLQKLKSYFDQKTDEKTGDFITDNAQNNKLNILPQKSNLPIIYIVSGLPRSGTSMMMQILEKAGMNIFSDNIRQADESNPKGYYEHEAVKRLARDKTWISQTEGKVVKVISHLLFHLPENYQYKIVFMNRNLNEILKSQQKMLLANGKINQESHSLTLEISYKKNLEKVREWSEKKQNVEILYVNHRDLLDNSEEEIQKVFQFLNLKCDINDLTEVIDKKLYRTK